MAEFRTKGSIGSGVRLVENTDLFAGSRYEDEIIGYANAGNRSVNRLECTHREYLPYEMMEELSAFTRYRIVQGDRLDNLAFAFLGDSRLWWAIADLNPKEIRDTAYLPINVTIKIPTLSFITSMGLV